MKKLFIALMAAVAIVFSMNSCSYEAGSVEVEYGWDMDEDGHLSFDNMNIAASLNSEMIAALDKEFVNEGFEEFGGLGRWVHAAAMSDMEANALVKLIIKNAKLESYTVSGYNYDFVVRYKISTQEKMKEVYRKNMYKPAE